MTFDEEDLQWVFAETQQGGTLEISETAFENFAGPRSGHLG